MRYSGSTVIDRLRSEIDAARANLGRVRAATDAGLMVAAMMRIAHALGFLEGVAFVEPRVASTLQPELAELSLASAALEAARARGQLEDASGRPLGDRRTGLERRLLIARRATPDRRREDRAEAGRRSGVERRTGLARRDAERRRRYENRH